MNRTGDRRQDLDQTTDFRPGTCLTPSEPLGQTLPLDELHAEIMLALLLPDLIDGHNVRKVQAGRRLDSGAHAPRLPCLVGLRYASLIGALPAAVLR